MPDAALLSDNISALLPGNCSFQIHHPAVKAAEIDHQSPLHQMEKRKSTSNVQPWGCQAHSVLLEGFSKGHAIRQQNKKKFEIWHRTTTIVNTKVWRWKENTRLHLWLGYETLRKLFYLLSYLFFNLFFFYLFYLQNVQRIQWSVGNFHVV